MASKIHILDEKTINQIAAGEVIENPASVIKELVDNAIDSGSDKIIIEVQGSGRQSIRVQDNGSGMSQDDALLCLERHATSKIQKFDDLWNLSTMGFRGEALSSIAAISELSILTAIGPSNELCSGTSVEVSGGKVLSCTPTKCFGGTTIHVGSLFFNVPARRKFQKSPTKDASDILKVVSLLALAHPEISFELITNQKKELQLEANSDDRLKVILGKEFASELIPISYKNDLLSITGFIGKPLASRSTRSGQYLFVNRRPIESLFISKAIKEAYGTSIDDARHPIYVLHVDIAPERVDVNVHPQKRHVRFLLEEEIKRVLQEILVKALFKTAPTPIPQIFTTKPQTFSFSQSNYSPPKPEIPVQLPIIKRPFRVIGTIWHYIFADLSETEGEDHFSVIDAKLALSKITHEALQTEKEPSQMLLVPIFVELSLAEAELLKEKLPLFHEMGINIYEFGHTAFMIDAKPASFDYVDIPEWIRATLHEAPTRMRELATISQRLSLPITEPLAEQIIKKLLSCTDPWRSHTGASIVSQIQKAELQKKFSL